MKILSEKIATKFEVGYFPNGEILKENPARFTFMPEDDISNYIIQVSLCEKFSKIEYEFVNLDLCFFTPDITFKPGKYFWRYAGYKNKKIISNFSKIRYFFISEDSHQSPLINREKRYSKVNLEHPRLWINSSDIKKIKIEIKENKSAYDFDLFYENSVKKFINKKLPTMQKDFNYDWSEFECDLLPPEPPANPQKNRKRWRATYITCQEIFYKVRHLSIAGLLLEDLALIEESKNLLVHIAKWNRKGSTFHDINDEACYRLTKALTWGYDYLLPFLDANEEKLVREMLYERLKHTYIYMRDIAKIHLTPYNSHPIRSINMVVIPACIVLLGHYDEIEEWLNYSIEYMYNIYNPWGGEDGGWAEGALYWTTAMAAAFEGMNSILTYLNINVYDRLFFQKTGDFILNCFTSDTIRSSFGDQSNLGRKVTLKTGFLMRQLASMTKNKKYQFYYNSFLPWDVSEFDMFFNYGWWDFYFENFLHLYSFEDIEIEEPSARALKVFNDVGWAAIHYNYTNFNNHVQLLFKSSPFGSVSHSHADQNAFNLHAFGEPLAVETGYYYDYGGKMHSHWCKQTISENSILIDSKGQYTFEVDLVYETKSYKKLNMIKQIEANGMIIDSYIAEDYISVKGDATNAYLPNVPSLKEATREIFFVDDAYFIIKDVVNLTEEKDITFLFHTLYKMKLEENSFHVKGTKASLDAFFIHSSSGIKDLRQHNLFTGVPEEEYADRERQWHLLMTTNESKSHTLFTLLIPYKNDNALNVDWVVTNDKIEISLNKKKFILNK